MFIIVSNGRLSEEKVYISGSLAASQSASTSSTSDSSSSLVSLFNLDGSVSDSKSHRFAGLEAERAWNQTHEN